MSQIAERSFDIHWLQDNSYDELIAICLWGPPGCGKSSAIVNIQNLENNNNKMMVYNTIFVTYYWTQLIFYEEFKNYLARRPTHLGNCFWKCGVNSILRRKF